MYEFFELDEVEIIDTLASLPGWDSTLAAETYQPPIDDCDDDFEIIVTLASPPGWDSTLAAETYQPPIDDCDDAYNTHADAS